MNYNINKLNSQDFEYMVQSFARTMLGNGAITFGSGPDGGREATFEGKANYPNEIDQWDGYWVVQAKYRNVKIESEGKDFTWLKSEINKEVIKYVKRKSKVKIPDNLLFFTNIILTATANTGGRDQANSFITQIKNKYQIKNVSIVSYDDIITLLNNNRDIAVTFSSFILPGDILNELFKLLERTSYERKRLTDLIGRYLEIEFKNNISSKLEHAGKLTSDRINLEKVFIDLHATKDGNIPSLENAQPKFISNIINVGNKLLKPSLNRESRFVLIAGPGYGKSTLTQFLCQVYRATFLENIDACKNLLPEVNDFIFECKNIIWRLPSCIRFPFRIVLKDYASWISLQATKGESSTIISYICYVINKRCGEKSFTNNVLEEFITITSTVFIFDGLDEVPSSSNREQMLEEINTFTDIILRRTDADALIIATSRPQGYTKEFNESAYNHLIITDLRNEDCLDYINKLILSIEEDVDKRTEDFQILKKASTDLIVSRLMKSPLQASIMTILVKSGGEPPRNKYELFTEYYSTIFKREKQKNVVRILIESPNYINEIHYKLGFKLQSASESGDQTSSTISVNDFKLLIKEYLINDVGLEEIKTEIMVEHIIEASTTRLIFIEEVQAGFIGFNIRSMQEYFAANYYISQPDDLIKEKLKNISISSYWNNTLMFCIGYLFKYKIYSIDHVESIFSELNGSEQPGFSTYLPALYYHGSCISIDILNESIFRGHPKLENKFSKYIYPLLTIPFIDKHYDLLRLPDQIKNEWLIRFAKKGIESDDFDTKCTSWAIIFLIAKHHNEIDCQALLEKSEFKNDMLLKILVNKNILNSDCTITILTNLLNHEKVQGKYYKTIDELSPQTILKWISTTSDEKILNEIFFYYFIKCFYSNYFEDGELIAKINELLLQKAKVETNINFESYVSYFHNKDSNLDFIILPNTYKGRINLFCVPNREHLENLLKAANHYKNEFMIAFINFHLYPSKGSLTQVIHAIDITDESAIAEVKKVACANWVILNIFNNNSNTKEIIQQINENIFGDENTWNQQENEFKNDLESVSSVGKLLDKSTYRIMNGSTLSTTLISMIELAKQTNIDAYYIEVTKLLNWFPWEEEDSFHVLFEENFLHFLKALEKFNSSARKMEEIIVSTFTFVLFSPHECIIAQIERINNICKNIKYAEKYYLYRYSTQQLFKAMKKVIQIFNVTKDRSTEAYILRLIPYILLADKHTIKDLYVFIDIETFSIENMDNDNLLAFSCICLFILSKDDSKIDLLKQTINKIIFTEKLMNLFLIIVQGFKKNKNLEPILLLLNEKVKNQYLNKSLLLQIIKDHTESQASLINNNK